MRRFLVAAAACAALTGLAGCGGGGHHHDGDSAANVPPVSFDNTTTVSVGASFNPSGVVTADLNGDGRLDVAVANLTDNSVSVMLGNGSGSLGAATNVALGANTGPTAVVAGDFNGDGKIDLAVAEGSANAVVILTNNGNASFTIGSTIALAPGSNPSALVATDVNGDGKLDLAIADAGTANVAVAIGNGNGTFQAAVTSAVTAGFTASGITAGDLNGDGKVDLALSSSTDGKVAVLLGNGTATFNAASTMAAGGGIDVSGIVSGDFNADGKMDLAASVADTGNVALFLGNGDGTFQTATTVTAGADAKAIAAGDFNADGKLDLIVGLGSSGDVAVLRGNGDGTFLAATNFAISATGASSIALGDLDANGSMDVAVAESTTGNVAVLLGSSHAITLGFSSGGTLSLGLGALPANVVTGDFNGDGNVDVAVSDKLLAKVDVFLGTGNGTFASAISTNVGAGLGPTALSTGDFNADGKADLAVALSTGSSVQILLGAGNGTFSSSGAVALTPGFGASAVVTGDFDGDGKVDVAVASNPLGKISVATGAGNGTFNAAVDFTLSAGFAATAMASGDFNHDGKLDLAVSSGANGTVDVMLGTGTGSFSAPTTLTVSGGANISDVLAVDVNHDGNLDLVATNATSGQVAVMLGEGDGSFQAAMSSSAGAGASAVVAGDFNRDGKLDLAVALSGSGQVAVLLGNGNGTFAAASDFSAGGTGSADLTVGDFNGDGKLDIAVTNQTTANVGILLGQ